VDVESILGEEEVWSRHARVTVWTGHNFFKILLEFLDVLFHIVEVESILGERRSGRAKLE